MKFNKAIKQIPDPWIVREAIAARAIDSNRYQSDFVDYKAAIMYGFQWDLAEDYRHFIANFWRNLHNFGYDKSISKGLRTKLSEEYTSLIKELYSSSSIYSFSQFKKVAISKIPAWSLVGSNRSDTLVAIKEDRKVVLTRLQYITNNVDLLYIVK